LVALSSIGILASCTQETKPQTAAAPPVIQSAATIPPGQAGRVSENVFRTQAVVSAIDVPSRRVTLKGSSGKEYTFTAGPEVKNLPQLKVGDTVSATFDRRMVITVRSDNAAPSESYDSTSGTAMIGDKPGMLIAEETRKVARVKSIDTINRTADLEFTDGVIKAVPIRPDVDLSQYKAGDNVNIRVTTALTVLTEAP
jgi:Cu/Ag efflux protein CusF